MWTAPQLWNELASGLIVARTHAISSSSMRRSAVWGPSAPWRNMSSLPKPLVEQYAAIGPQLKPELVES